jgi:uncharacterized protein YecE (DUF72 family)
MVDAGIDHLLCEFWYENYNRKLALLNAAEGWDRMVDWLIGTMGFGWKDWRGGFYPEDLDSRDYLGYYSRRFNAVEIDSTFYGPPRQDSVRRWAAETPPNFKICAKTPKQITHEAGLRQVVSEMWQFVEVMLLLEQRLGVILLQFPPSFSAENLDLLAKFTPQLPDTARYAVEFRHSSWYSARTAEVLARHRLAWAASEYAELPRQVETTADFLYVRFIGQHGRFHTHGREQDEMRASLEWWRQRLLALSGQVRAVYGFFNNDYAGHAPASANRFKLLLGLPVAEPRPPVQPRLI